MRKPLNDAPANRSINNLPINGAIGRFAPSPTGALHLGSLTTAIASYCHIKALKGRWLLRIEDTDRQRCSQKFSDKILLDLERLGLCWDGEVVYQSQRIGLYNELLYNQLLPRLYGCECSRKQLRGYTVYPRNCLPSYPRNYLSSYPKSYLPSDSEPSPSQNFICLEKIKSHLQYKKVRIQLPDYSIGFLDKLQGMQWVNPQQTLGDVVLRRADGIINYFLAVSVDDGLQGITHIMRGLDILPLTTAQIVLMQYLDLPPVSRWYHLPLVKNEYGQKLSKQNLATPIDTSSVEKCQQLICHALNLLRQPPVAIDAPKVMLTQAATQWQNAPLQYQQSLGQL